MEEAEEKKEKSNVRGIIIHPDIIDKRLFDARGNGWILEELKDQPPDSFVKDMLLAKRIGATFDSVTADNVASSLVPVLRSYIENNFKNDLDGVLRSADPLIQQCLSEGEKEFKKSLISAIVERGKDIFTRLLAEEFLKIGEVFAKQKAAEEGRVFCSNIMPPGVRLKWQSSTPSYLLELFLVEQPPQMRTVLIKGRFYRLAFPWTRFFVMFINKNFGMFWAFYGKEQLVSENSQLFKPGLPHFQRQWPCNYCIGDYSYNRLKTDMDWWNLLIEDFFWSREFLPNGNPGYSEHWIEMQSYLPEITDFENWEKISSEDPASILRVSWLDFGKTVGEFGAEMMEWYLRNKIGATSKKSDSEVVQKEIINHFKEKIAEEIYFLTEKFIIPHDTQKAASQFSAEKIKLCKEEFVKALTDNCGEIARTIVNACLDIKEKEEGKR